MKLTNSKIATSKKFRGIILLGTIAAAAATVACSRKSEPKNTQSTYGSVQPAATVKQASLSVTTPSYSQPKSVETKPVEKVQHPKSGVMSYKSRNYGVQFEYPWQYSYVSAKSIATNEELQPKSDGHEGQITLARIDLPKGFYPDTDFERGYFTLGLNPEIEEHDCKSVLGTGKDVKTEKVNDTEFSWVESDEGGKGTASKVRTYVAYANDSCYEIELGVLTNNADGLSREVNADQVMGRLEGMLKSVKIAQPGQKVQPEVQVSENGK